MANILPVFDLRNYNEVLKNCHKGEPVYLTKNGRGGFVVMDFEDYERDRAEKKLLMKLQEAVKDGEGWLNLDELKALVGNKMLKLRINPIVAKDLKNIRAYIAKDNEEYVAKTIKEIYGKFENFQMFPGMGSDLSKRVSFRTDYKYAIWEDYVIIYKVSNEYVEIYRVINRYQDITRVF